MGSRVVGEKMCHSCKQEHLLLLSCKNCQRVELSTTVGNTDLLQHRRLPPSSPCRHDAHTRGHTLQVTPRGIRSRYLITYVIDGTQKKITRVKIGLKSISLPGVPRAPEIDTEHYCICKIDIERTRIMMFGVIAAVVGVGKHISCFATFRVGGNQPVHLLVHCQSKLNYRDVGVRFS